MNIVDKLLSLLPLNGDKTRLSALLFLLGLAKHFFPGLQILSFIEQYLTEIAAGGLLLGVSHKVVKSSVGQ